MDRTFEYLALWDDPTERDGPGQMACDEALLEAVRLPVLRIFRWKDLWVSAGYFADREQARRAHPERSFCRRWTGGGVVAHGQDFTFALAVPREEKLARLRAGESYRNLHLALAEALRRQGIGAELCRRPSGAGAECFAGGVEHDLMLNGFKIAGGAQRRTRRGLLHQGSVQGLPDLGRTFGQTLAGALAHSVGCWNPPSDFERRVEELTRTKYATPGFLRGPRAAACFTPVAAP